MPNNIAIKNKCSFIEIKREFYAPFFHLSNFSYYNNLVVNLHLQTKKIKNMKKIVQFSLVLLISILNINCTNNKPAKDQSSSGQIMVISPVDFKSKSVNQTIIDIRTPGEYRDGYIDGAVNINFYDRNFLEQVSKFDKEQPIFIYCRSGNRTSSASRKLNKYGFKLVYDLDGGIKNWKRANNKIIK